MRMVSTTSAMKTPNSRLWKRRRHRLLEVVVLDSRGGSAGLATAMGLLLIFRSYLPGSSEASRKVVYGKVVYARICSTRYQINIM